MPQATHSTSHRPVDVRRTLSVVVPVFNERQVLPATLDRLFALGDAVASAGYSIEIVFVDDGSADGSAAFLDDAAGRDARVVVVHLSRNFGHQAAVSCGLLMARGSKVAVLDCDLQDPPEVLPEFLIRSEQGFQVVYGVRRARKEGFLKRLAYWGFYRLMSRVSTLRIPLDAGDFCLMDRSAVDLLNSLPERNRFVRGLRSWIGLRQVGVEYERAARAAGRPKYTPTKLLRLAIDGLCNFSDAPLRLVTNIGLLGVCCAVLLAAWVLYITLSEWGLPASAVKTPRGWASIACIVLFLSSVQLLSLGVIGEYLSRVFLEVKGRPTYLIASVVRHSKESTASHNDISSPSVHDHPSASDESASVAQP